MNIKYVVFSLIALIGSSCWGAASSPDEKLGMLAELYANGALDAATKIIERLDPLSLQRLALMGQIKQKQNPKLLEYPDLLRDIRHELAMRADRLVQLNDGNVQKAFFEAAKSHPWALSFLVEQGANVNALNDYGLTALMMAASQGNQVKVAQLIAAGANLEAISKLGYTALMLAAASGKKATVAQLLAANADIDAISPTTGETALIFAIEAKKYDVATLLIDNGANVNIVVPITGQTALMGAISQDDENMVSILLKAGANANHKAQFGASALRKALKTKGRISEQLQKKNIMQALINYGANIENFGPELREMGIKLLGE